MRSTWRLDIAIARFSLVKRGDLRAFVLVGSEEHGERILELMGRAFDFYCSRFGERERRYTIIEIPDGYGGQAGVDYSLVESRALREPIPYGVYHELAHFWNPKAEGEVQRSRFFDEAFANYLTALLIRELYGEEEFRRVLRELRKAYWRLVNDRFPEGREVPLADYGRYELGALSYSKGALVLYELHKLIGDSFYQLVHHGLRAGTLEFGIPFWRFEGIELGDNALMWWLETCTSEMWAGRLTPERAVELARMISAHTMEAERRSFELLVRTLGEGPARQLLEQGELRVRSANGQDYAITRDGEVFHLRAGGGRERVCVVVEGERTLPLFDRIVAKYLVIRDHPERIRALDYHLHLHLLERRLEHRVRALRAEFRLLKQELEDLKRRLASGEQA